MKVFVGYDSREDIAYRVCEYSIKKHCPNADVVPLVQEDLRKINFACLHGKTAWANK